MVLAANMTKINLTSRKREISLKKKKNILALFLSSNSKIKDHRKFFQPIPKFVFGNIIYIPESVGLRNEG